jgi:RNA polymerase sigma factor (sigma-70 family)
MGPDRIGGAVRQLQRAVLVRDGAGLTDGQLLDRFVIRHDEDAFAALVKRHGPMVLGVCRRILGDTPDAEDAFQATFLVLVRKAATVLPREMVANFLHGVAFQTARKARAQMARRRARERQVIAMPEPEAVPEEVWDDLLPLLDRELSLLPAKYRVPVVLCDLEGKSRREAAHHLGWPEGTLSGRLSRARSLLARRLSRHGPMLSAGTLSVLLAENATSAPVPPTLAANAFRAATGVLSARVIALAEGVVKTMLLSKLNLTVALILVAFVAGLATRVWSGPALAQEPGAEPAPPAETASATPAPLRQTLDTLPWVLTHVDPAKHTVSVWMRTKANWVTEEDLVFANILNINSWNTTPVPQTPPGSRLCMESLPISRSTKVTIDGKDGNLAGLKVGMRVSLKFATEEPVVMSLDAQSVPSDGEVMLKSLDTDARTITITLAGKELTLAVSPDVQIFLNTTGRGTFKDLTAGLYLSLTLGVERDRIAVQRILGRKDGT